MTWQPDPYSPEIVRQKWMEDQVDSALSLKYHPAVAGGGENLPLEILRYLSEWFSVLEARGTVPGQLYSLSSGQKEIKSSDRNKHGYHDCNSWCIRRFNQWLVIIFRIKPNISSVIT